MTKRYRIVGPALIVQGAKNVPILRVLVADTLEPTFGDVDVVASAVHAQRPVTLSPLS